MCHSAFDIYLVFGIELIIFFYVEMTGKIKGEIKVRFFCQVNITGKTEA